MQEVYKDGSYGEPKPYDEEGMKESLKKEEVDHVAVFNQDSIHKRKMLFEQSQAAKRKTRKAKNRIQSKSRKNK